MKNNIVDVQFNNNDGTIKSIKNCSDEHQMNWCSETANWGKILCTAYDDLWGDYLKRAKNMEMIFCESKDDYFKAIYSNTRISVEVNRFFNKKGNFVEKYTLKNLTNHDIFLEDDTFGIILPFNDILNLTFL